MSHATILPDPSAENAESRSGDGQATPSLAEAPSTDLITAETVTSGLAEVEAIEEARLVPKRRRWIVRAWFAWWSAVEWCLGVASLILGMAFLTAVPLLQFMTLGYLLEVSGRMARKGRVGAGFVGVRKAARVGSVVAGTFLLLLPLRYLTTVWIDSRIIDPTSTASRLLGLGLIVLSVLLVGHILGAWARGGRLRHFLIPWNYPWLLVNVFRPTFWARARDSVWTFVASLRLRYYLWLGIRGFVGGAIWLFPPITLIAMGTRGAREQPFLGLIGFLGAVALMWIMLHVPFLLTRMAAENRFSAVFEWRAVRRLFARAPIAFWIAVFISVLFTLPLFLFKVEIIPQEAAWLPGLLFVVTIFPAHFLAGWAYLRGQRRERPRHWVWRWLFRLSFIPVTMIYALFVFISQFTNWYGVWGMYEQYQFLVPAPFLEVAVPSAAVLGVAILSLVPNEKPQGSAA
jgi:hypothetical protein